MSVGRLSVTVAAVTGTLLGSAPACPTRSSPWPSRRGSGFTGWRGEVLAEKQKEYVEAARAVGRAHLGIIVKEILPNIMHTMLVLATLRLGYMIIMEASPSFLGLAGPGQAACPRPGPTCPALHEPLRAPGGA